MAFASLIGAVAALGFATGAGDGSPARWRAGEAVARLEVRPAPEEPPAGPELPAPAPAPEVAAPPSCIADVCQARVEVPGFAVRFGRPSRSELAATLLDRSGLEPFATVAWLFVATGVRVDWSPPAYDAGSPGAADGRGWGSLFVRLKLRVDAMNRLVVPERRRTRQARSWSALIAPRA